MAVVAEKVTLYRTSDGRGFESRLEAEQHEAEQQVTKWVNDEGLGRGGHWDEEMIRSTIWEGRHALYAIFRQLELAEAQATGRG